MRAELVELFFTDEMRIKYQKIEPYKDCDKCKYGVKIDTQEICECSLSTILDLILDVPERYDVECVLSKQLETQLKNFKNFLLITGEEKYVKLLAFHLAKQFLKDDKIVKYVRSKGLTVADKLGVIDDIVSFNKADVVLFEDVFTNLGNIEYKSELSRRIDKNKTTIFINKTQLINMNDDDFYNVEVDSNDIEIEAI